MNESKILGVCAWLSDSFSLDVKVVRIIFVAAFILGMGSPVILYLILYVVKILVTD